MGTFQGRLQMAESTDASLHSNALHNFPGVGSPQRCVTGRLGVDIVLLLKQVPELNNSRVLFEISAKTIIDVYVCVSYGLKLSKVCKT